MVEAVIFFALIIQILFSIVFFLGTITLKRSTRAFKNEKTFPPISVIIAARDESANLNRYLKSVLDQDYENFEVIVVDDRSIDNTLEVLERFQEKHGNLRVVSIKPGALGPQKKAALARGIESAEHEHLVFTDADCVPTSNQWLKSYGRAFARGYQLVIGVGDFRNSGGLINALYRLEALRISLRYLSAAVFGRPYMAVGRSLGYTKSLYNTVGGFANHMDVQSGDDDLFVQSVPLKTKVVALADAATISDAPKTLRSWVRQKSRHQSTGMRYSMHSLILLGVFEVTDFVTVLGLLLHKVLFSPDLITTFLSFCVIKYTMHLLNLTTLESVIAYRSTSLKLFAFDFVLSLVNPLFSVFTQLSKQPEWRRGK